MSIEFLPKRPIIKISGDVEFQFDGEDTPLLKIADRSSPIVIYENSVIGIFGPNGCGKTTLINMLCGLLPPTKGGINYYGPNGSKKPYKHTNLNFHFYTSPLNVGAACGGQSRTFQVVRLPEYTGIKDFCSVGGEERIRAKFSDFFFHRLLNNRSKSRKLKYLDQKLNEFGFDQLDRQIGSLSYGQKRLLSVIQALESNDRLLVLDEPFANLHKNIIKKLKKNFREYVMTASSRVGRAILWVEHSPEHINDLADMVIQFTEEGIVIKNISGWLNP